MFEDAPVLLLMRQCRSDEGEWRDLTARIGDPQSGIRIVFGRYDFTGPEKEDPRSLNISRRHCSMHCDPSGWRVIDESKNGTTVIREGQDPVRIHQSSMSIKPGDILEFEGYGRVLVRRRETAGADTISPISRRELGSD